MRALTCRDLLAEDGGSRPLTLDDMQFVAPCNVTVSRAQTLCVTVGQPCLAVTRVAMRVDLKRANFVSAQVVAGEERPIV